MASWSGWDSHHPLLVPAGPEGPSDLLHAPPFWCCALCIKVLTPHLLCCMRWLEFKWRYWSVWVGFLCTPKGMPGQQVQAGMTGAPRVIPVGLQVKSSGVNTENKPFDTGQGTDNITCPWIPHQKHSQHALERSKVIGQQWKIQEANLSNLDGSQWHTRRKRQMLISVYALN